METEGKSLAAGSFNVIISATAMASLPILGKLAYSAGLGPINTLLLRYITAFVFVSLIIISGRNRRIIYFTPLILLQGIFLFMASIFYFQTIRYLSAGLTNVIFFTHPIIVSIMAIFFYKEKIYPRLVIGLVMALAGIVMISGIGTVDGPLHLKGIIMGSAASINYAFYCIIGQKNVYQTDPLRLTNTMAMICIVLLAAVFHEEVQTLFHLELNQIFIGMLIGVLATVLAVTFLMRGIRLIGAAKASLISASEPALTLIMAFFILNEVLNTREMAGSILVFTSIIFAVLPRKANSIFP